MQTLLDEHAVKGTLLGFTTQERVRSYVVQPGVPVAVECRSSPVIWVAKNNSAENTSPSANPDQSQCRVTQFDTRSQA